jgi:DNA-binding NarL/FixJ family response regulator
MASAQQNRLLSFIASVSGEQAAHRVWKEFGGSQPYIPRYPKSDEKQAFILSALERGENVHQIAKQLDLTERQIYVRLNQPLRKQTTLFGT